MDIFSQRLKIVFYVTCLVAQFKFYKKLQYILFGYFEKIIWYMHRLHSFKKWGRSVSPDMERSSRYIGKWKRKLQQIYLELSHLFKIKNYNIYIKVRQFITIYHNLLCNICLEGHTPNWYLFYFVIFLLS